MRIDRRGFLLFEVMVSIIVIAVGLTLIARSYASSKNAIGRSRDYIKTAVVMEEVLWPYEEKGIMAVGSESGKYSEDENFAWTVNSEPEQDSTLNRVRLEVYQKKDPENTRYFVTTFLNNEQEEE